VTGASGWEVGNEQVTTTKRNGACEVCGDRLANAANSSPVCMTYGDGRIGQLENGYKCIGNKK